MNPADDLDPKLFKQLKNLQSTQPRDAAAAARGKARYLAEARQLAVTSMGLKRLTIWIENFKSLFRRKEKAPMFSTIISVFVILATLIGGGGITMAVAQASQPGDFLYPVKAISEDANYQLTFGDQNRLNLSLDYADRRMAEIQSMLENSQVPPDVVQLRLQAHLQTALELSVKNMDDAEKLLEQVRLRLEQQLQTRLQQTNSNPAGEALRLQVRDMLQMRIGWIEDGLKQLSQLRLQTQNQQQTQQQTQQPTQLGQSEGVQGSGGNGSNADQMQGDQGGNGYWTPAWMMTATPTGMQYQYQNGNGSQGGSGSGQGK